jgi:predicted nucleotidyltransferase
VRAKPARVVPYIRIIAMSSAEATPFIDAFAARLAAEPDIRVAVLFGSGARGRLRPDSDVDVYLRLGPRVRWSTHRVLLLASELGAIARREVDLVIEDVDATSTILRLEVARHGVLLFERQPGAWTSLRASAFIAHADLEPWMRRCAEGVRRRILRESCG